MADYPGVTRRPARKLVQYSLNQAQPSMRIFNAMLAGAEEETYAVISRGAAQRVFCPSLGVWCYYTGPITSTPDPTSTVPNWTVSIERHQILGEI